MATPNFLIWIVVIAIATLTALSAMLWAYNGSGSVKVVFSEPIGAASSEPAPTLNEQAAQSFQAGILAFQAQQYRVAIDRFTQASQLDPTCAEALHNLGLTTANLRQIPTAAHHLAKAAELYLEQNNQTGFQQVKQNLEQLKI